MVDACHAICQQYGNGWRFCFGCLKGCGTDLYVTGTQMLTQPLYWASPFWLSSFFRISVAKVQRKEGKWSKAKYVRYHWQEELGWTHSGGSWKLKLTYGSWILGSWRIKGKFLCGVGNPYFGIKGVRMGESPQKMPCEKDDNEFKEKKDNLGQDKVSALQAWSLNFGTPIPM